MTYSSVIISKLSVNSQHGGPDRHPGNVYCSKISDSDKKKNPFNWGYKNWLKKTINMFSTDIFKETSQKGKKWVTEIYKIDTN